MTPEQAAALRKPFPPEAVGKLPKGGVMLDYVGHAAATDRLLQVDPDWSWEPFALDAHGLPALDSSGNLWIRLTIGGVTRPGVGDGKTMKERIGDAIRNAAMRFGVALDLWAKEDLQPGLPASAPDRYNDNPQPTPPPARSNPSGLRSDAQSTKLAILIREHQLQREEALAWMSGLVGRDVTSTKELTKGEASKVIDALESAVTGGVNPVTGELAEAGR